MAEKPFIACRIPQGLYDLLNDRARDLGENKKTQVIIDALSSHLGYSDIEGKKPNNTSSSFLTELEEKISKLEALIHQRLGMYEQIASSLGDRVEKLEQAGLKPAQSSTTNRTLQRTIFEAATENDKEIVIDNDNEEILTTDKEGVIKFDNVEEKTTAPVVIILDNVDKDSRAEKSITERLDAAGINLPAAMHTTKIIQLPGIEDWEISKLKQKIRNIRHSSKSQTSKIGPYLCKFLDKEPGLKGELIFEVSLAQEA